MSAGTTRSGGRVREERAGRGERPTRGLQPGAGAAAPGRVRAGVSAAQGRARGARSKGGEVAPAAGRGPGSGTRAERLTWGPGTHAPAAGARAAEGGEAAASPATSEAGPRKRDPRTSG